MPAATTIAVVDDKAIREAIHDLILPIGYESLHFPSTGAFLTSEQRANVDCILVDVHVPGLSSIELQSELNRRGPHRPMISVTCSEDDRTRNAALSGGAFACLRKTVAVDSPVRCLEAALTRPV